MDRTGAQGRRSAAALALSALLVLAGGPAAALEWGSTPAPSPGVSEVASLRALERDAGRRFDVVRVFLRRDSPFPTDQHRAMVRDGRRLVLSLATRRLDRTPVRWADIAAARPGTRLDDERRAWVDRIQAFPGVRSFTLSHEPELERNADLGVAADFTAAWRAVVGLFRQHPAPDPTFMWIMTDHAFRQPASDRRHPDRWYPGDGWVGAVAQDAYIWHVCRSGTQDNPWRPLRTIVEPMRRWAQRHPHAQRVLGEPAYARFRGVAYFNVPTSCGFTVRSSPSALAAFGAFGRSLH